MSQNRVQKNSYWDESGLLKRLNISLRNNNISITSTDTVLGLLGIAQYEVLMKINMLKKRSSSTPCIVLITSELLKNYVDWSRISLKDKNFINNITPISVTFLLPAAAACPAGIASQNGKVGVRVTPHHGLKRLISLTGGLLSTSANISGEKPPVSLSEVSDDILKGIDYTVVDRDSDASQYESRAAQRAEINGASTILDIDSERGGITLVREGSIASLLLEKEYGQQFNKK